MVSDRKMLVITALANDKPNAQHVVVAIAHNVPSLEAKTFGAASLIFGLIPTVAMISVAIHRSGLHFGLPNARSEQSMVIPIRNQILCE